MIPINQFEIPIKSGTLIFYMNRHLGQFRILKINSLNFSEDVYAFDSGILSKSGHHPRKWASSWKFFLPTEREVIFHYALEHI